MCKKREQDAKKSRIGEILGERRGEGREGKRGRAGLKGLKGRVQGNKGIEDVRNAVRRGARVGGEGKRGRASWAGSESTFEP